MAMQSGSVKHNFRKENTKQCACWELYMYFVNHCRRNIYPGHEQDLKLHLRVCTCRISHKISDAVKLEIMKTAKRLKSR